MRKMTLAVFYGFWVKTFPLVSVRLDDLFGLILHPALDIQENKFQQAIPNIIYGLDLKQAGECSILIRCTISSNVKRDSRLNVYCVISLSTCFWQTSLASNVLQFCT